MQTPNEDMMAIGFLMAGFAWTLWWNIDCVKYHLTFPATRPTRTKSKAAGHQRSMPAMN